MKRQDYVFGSTTSNIEEQTPEALNNGWVELSILYSRVLNGVCAALSQSTNIVSQEVANAIVGMGVALNPASDNQLLQVLQKLAIKATDFESPITASNKGATMKEIEEVVTSSFRFKGYVSTTQPTNNLVVDNLWINLPTMPSTFPVSASLIKKWNGSAWVNYGSAYTPMNFDAFRNNNDNEGYYWFGGQWKLLSTDLSTDYFRLNQTSGKWEIKSSVNLPGTPTCDTPSASNTRAIANVDFINNNTISSRNFTNCITEIPQDIKLEIVDGAVVLKAGSKGYRPNGAGVFNQITSSTDISKTISTDGVYMVVSWELSALDLVNINSCFSGATQPVNPPRISVWYDTTNNVIKQTYDSGATWGGTLLFPLGIVTVSNGKVSSIDQVFNGFGYIGSCVFTLPGVKGLYPNGRNEDGTLKNGLINCTDVQVSSNFNDTVEHTLMINPNGRCAWYSTTGWYYNDIANVMVASTGTVLKSATLGTFKTTNGVVSNLNPYEAFHAVDYSEYLQTKKSLDDKVSELDNELSEKVNKSGDTITGNLAIQDGEINLKSTVIDITSSGWTAGTNVIASCIDKNDYESGGIYNSIRNDKNVITSMYAASRIDDNDSPSYGYITVGVNSNGDAYATAPSTSGVAGSNAIATVGWVNSKFVRVVAEQKATSSNNRTWYRKYSDGWVEQGGRLNITSSNRTILFPVPMADKDNYNLQATVTSALRYACVEHDTDRTTTGFKVATADDNTANNDGVVDWKVCGYAAN